MFVLNLLENVIMDNITAILIAGGVMLGIALIFGIILVIFSHVFNVEKDSKIAEVENLLAKSNCGGCGKAGCSAFAEALVKGEAKISDCNSTSKENKEKICELLGSGEVGEQTVAIVHCNGGNACFDKYDYQGYGDCNSCELIAGGVKACPVGCIGKKVCSSLCPYNAINVNGDGYAVVDKEKCVSCGICILNCPKKLISRIPKSAKVYIACSNHGKGKDVKELCSHGCIGCGICAKNCPENAITLVDNLPVIDYKKCTGCLTCVAKCPVKCIKEHK